MRVARVTPFKKTGAGPSANARLSKGLPSKGSPFTPLHKSQKRASLRPAKLLRLILQVAKRVQTPTTPRTATRPPKARQREPVPSPQVGQKRRQISRLLVLKVQLMPQR